MTPRKILTAENAVITTATVSVHALTIEGRQVTMAVFRQLIEEDIVAWKNETPSLKGVPWGHVRYLIDEPVNKAINLVWQRGSELRRCNVHKKFVRYGREYAKAMTNPTVSGYDGAKATDTWPWRGDEPLLEKFEGPSLDYTPGDDHDTWERKKAAREKAYERFMEAIKGAIAKEYVETEKEADAYDALVAPLFDLPQLFIAT